MKRLVCIVLSIGALILVAAASAQAGGRFDGQTFVNPDGSGKIFYGRGTGPWVWEACARGPKDCEPFARGRELQTGKAAAGTVFRVTEGAGESWVSPEWRGRVESLAPPRVAGVIAANEFVSPVPGLWSGGWQGEDAELQLAACATEAGSECISLTSPRLIRHGCTSNSSFPLDPRFAGMYLRVADKQSGGPHAEAAGAVYSPSGATWGFESVWGRSRTTSVAIVGQIAAAVNPSPGECGPPRAPVATISSKGVARVECVGGCSVVLAGARKGLRQLVTRRIGEGSLLRPWPALELGLPPSAAALFGAGKVRLTVTIDGSLAASRIVSTPPS
jgi:hypothetical protein